MKNLIESSSGCSAEFFAFKACWDMWIQNNNIIPRSQICVVSVSQYVMKFVLWTLTHASSVNKQLLFYCCSVFYDYFTNCVCCSCGETVSAVLLFLIIIIYSKQGYISIGSNFSEANLTLQSKNTSDHLVLDFFSGLTSFFKIRAPNQASIL